MVEDVTSADRIGPPKGEGGKGKSDHDPLDDIDFDKMPQDRLQRAFAIATGSGGTGDGFEVDPAGVKAAMKHLDEAYQKLEDNRDLLHDLSKVGPPGEEHASAGYVRRASRVGGEAYRAIEVIKKNLQQTYEAMLAALKGAQQTDEQNAEDLKRVDREMQ